MLTVSVSDKGRGGQTHEDTARGYYGIGGLGASTAPGVLFTEYCLWRQQSRGRMQLSNGERKAL
jgi:hypothetical protein